MEGGIRPDFLSRLRVVGDGDGEIVRVGDDEVREVGWGWYGLADEMREEG